jgi:hypothetical protein
MEFNPTKIAGLDFSDDDDDGFGYFYTLQGPTFSFFDF